MNNILKAHRQLIYQMTKREIASRYRGSALGIIWPFLTPLFMLAVYTFVFSVVFKAKWGGGGEESKAEFAIILFAGMIIHAFYCEVLLLSTNSIIGNSNYVKKVVFPLEILSIVTSFSALFNMLISTFVLFVISMMLGDTLHWTIIFTPLIILPIFVLAVGSGWIISALGVYMRDINQLMGIVSSILLFVSPVFFSVKSVPVEFQRLINLNPLTFIIEEFRKVFIWGELPDFTGLLIYLIISVVITSMAFLLFTKLRKGFADVL